MTAAKKKPELPWEVAYPLPLCGKARLVPESDAHRLAGMAEEYSALSERVQKFEEAAKTLVYCYDCLWSDDSKFKDKIPTDGEYEKAINLLRSAMGEK